MGVINTQFAAAALAVLKIADATSKVANFVKSTRLATPLVLPTDSPIADQTTQMASLAVEPPLSPIQLLSDMRAPKSLKDVLEPPLKDLGFLLCEDELPGKYGQERRQFSVVKKQLDGQEKQKRILIHVAKKILSVYTADRFAALATLPYYFLGSTVFVFSEKLDSANRKLRKFIENGWKDQHVTAVFIPWNDIDDLKQDDAQEQQRTVKEMLNLDNHSNGNSEVVLTTNERNKISQILVNMSTFQEETGRRNLLYLAGLEKIFQGVDLAGNSSTAAGIILRKLEAWGPISSGKHALGEFLRQICDQNTVNINDKSDLLAIINKYYL